MTHKIALSLALFATFGMTACTVDSPTPEDFNYSFLEELPGDSHDDRALDFHAVVGSDISLRFRDSLDGADLVDEDVAEAVLLVGEVQVGAYEDGAVVWRSIRTEPFKLDLMALGDGDAEELAQGPFSTGEYAGVALGIADAWVVDTEGRKSSMKLPGLALVINEKFALQEGDSTELVLNFGGLGGLEFNGETWFTEPSPSLDVYD